MRLLIVSNRLPITVLDGDDLNFQESVGGLVSGLKSYLDSLMISSSNSICKYIWVGWPGITIRDQVKEIVRSRLYSEFHSYPIFLSESTMDKFYNGFCNKTIWPLFHYFTTNVAYDENNWMFYKRVNRYICDTILQILRPDDVVWIHDYHLMLLPKLIKERVPSVPISLKFKIPSQSEPAHTMKMSRLEANTNRPDWDYSDFDLTAADPNLCAQACADDPQCKAFTYVKPTYQGPNARCWLKNKASNPVPDECCVSGAKGTR
ncbi:MAG: trehalose-6-phosphate synthase [Methanotrichaceae archaeon]|nr:trehalose-6-phosphate synthase [Methanotrichaceae archaeon]